MPTTTPLTPALTPPYAPDVEARLKKWMPPGVAFEPLELFRVLAKAPDMMAAMLPLGAYFLARQTLLPLRLRELVILRACAVAGCAYEWGAHVAGFADAAGLDGDAIHAVYHAGADSAIWNAEEKAVLAATSELVADRRLSDETRAALQAHFDEETRLMIVTLAAWYGGIIATVANTCCTGPEPWAPGFPPL